MGLWTDLAGGGVIGIAIGRTLGVVGGMVGTRMAADTASRLARWAGAPIPPGGGGLWGVATTGGAAALAWRLLRGVSPAIAGPLMLGAGVAVAEQALAVLLPVIGFGPSPSTFSPGPCPARPLLGLRRCSPALFSPSTVADPCATNFWRGRWVECRRPDGTAEARWCHDARLGRECCGPGEEYAGWPQLPPGS